MFRNPLKRLWEDGGGAVNGWLSIGNSFTAEIMAAQGYDSLTIDLQHGALDYADALVMLQAIRASGVAPIVRVPWLEPAAIMKALDAGAYGLICPMISTREQAELFVSCLRYPPDGARSFGPTRVGFAAGSDYYAAANREVVGFAMIETSVAMANLEEIVATPGLDAVYIGPADLTLGVTNGRLAPGFDRQEPEMVEAIDRILAVAKAAGVRVGIHCGSPEYAGQALARGFDLVTVANDVRLLASAAAATVARTRESAGQGGQSAAPAGATY
jgi:4-hydroxy-2-oxoheptanedioate aldolase